VSNPADPKAPAPLAVSGFSHLHAGHCESGVTASLFQNAGFPLSEPMVFGIGSGLFFAHFSFVRIMGHPLTTFRSFPGGIFKNACARLGVSCERETFTSPARGMARLDTLLAEGRRVGLQVNIFWLPYIPRPMRVHFNGHNLIVLEKRGDLYIVSDPVMECLFECPADALRRARFSGTHALLPRGLLYYPTRFSPNPDLRRAVEKSVREVCQHMLRIPAVFPWMGVRGIRHLAAQIASWPARMGDEKAREWLAGVVRMQEEIGTGGAGFRFIFAAYLQQAGESLDWPALAAMSEPTTAVGDRWRAFAVQASRLARGRKDVEWGALAPLLAEVAQAEEALFRELDAVQSGRRLLTGA
jgi:hypothetical protein